MNKNDVTNWVDEQAAEIKQQDAEAREEGLDARETWLDERQNSIGASDAAAALSASPFKSQFQLWSEKVGLAEPPSLDDVERVYWGNALEDKIVERFGEVTGRYVEWNGSHEITRHPNRPWMTATLDGTQECDERAGDGTGVLQIKTTGHWSGKEWETEPPLHCQIQLQHEIEVKGATWGTLAVLVAGQKLLWFDMERDDDFIEQLMAKEAWFWTQVLDKIPVPVDGSIATTDTLKRLYPKDDGEIISLPAEAADWDLWLREAKDSIKLHEGNKRKIENQIKAALGHNTCGILPNGDQYTFKNQVVNHKAKDAYANEFRVLRRKAN